jgi:hypothetical protein
VTDLLKGDLRIVNIGIIDFYEDFRRQGVEVVQVDWRPPGTGDFDLDQVLADII